MSQKYRVLAMLISGQAVSSYDIIRSVYKRQSPSTARLAARINDISRMGGKWVDNGKKRNGWFDERNRNKYWYQLKNPKTMQKLYGDFLKDYM